jgi:hypothetical protein
MNPEDADPRRAELVAEREELSRTVQALAERFDIPARARSTAGDVRDRVVSGFDRTVGSNLFVPTAAAIGGALALLVATIWWRRRARPRGGATQG